MLFRRSRADLDRVVAGVRSVGDRIAVWWRKREPLARVADLVDGQFVRVAGVVVEGGALTAPITGRTCVCFDAGVLGYGPVPGRVDGLGHPVTMWKPLARRLQGTPFVLEDDSGRAVVDPRGAVVQMKLDVRVPSLESYPHADPDLARLHAQADQVEFGEGVLVIGDEVVVLARAQLANASNPGRYRTPADTRVHLVGAPDRAAVVSKLPEDLEKARKTRRQRPR